ncbi:MAG: hypothetical protein ACKOC6_08805 [bacterium]
MTRTGLRAVRLRKALRAHAAGAVGDTGLVTVRGRVALEGPSFTPLSGRPCAGFVLEARGEGTRVGGRVGELRPFRVVGVGLTARVAEEDADLVTAVTAERTLAPGDPLPERLRTLLASSPELRWLLDRRVPLRLVERAVLLGSEVCVTAMARPAAATRAHAVAAHEMETVELAATGTDGAAFAVPAGGESLGLPVRSVWLEAADPFGRVLVSDRAPSARDRAPSLTDRVLAVAGPVLVLASILALLQIATPAFGWRV